MMKHFSIFKIFQIVNYPKFWNIPKFENFTNSEFFQIIQISKFFFWIYPNFEISPISKFFRFLYISNFEFFEIFMFRIFSKAKDGLAKPQRFVFVYFRFNLVCFVVGSIGALVSLIWCLCCYLYVCGVSTSLSIDIIYLRQ